MRLIHLLQIFAVVYLFASVPALAQQLPLPKAAVADQAALAQSMPALARQVIAQYKEENRERYFNGLFRVQIVAGDYAEAITALQALRVLRKTADPVHADTAFLVHEIYAQARLLQVQNNVPFDAAYKQAFIKLFGSLSDKQAHREAISFESNLTAYERDLRGLLDRRKDQETVSLAEALEIVGTYQLWVLYRDALPLSPALLAEDNNRRYLIQDDVLIKTPEGATLSAVVVRKRGNEAPQPAVLFFNIYADLAASLHEAKQAASRGYVGVAADTRGKRLSPDPIEPYEHEVKDTRAVIDWISRQPWNDGRVAMYGGSYTGFAQWAALKNPHPALKTIVPYAAATPGQGLPMENNIFINANYGWAFFVGNNKYLDNEVYFNRGRWEALNEKWFASGRPYREIDSVDGTPNRMLQRWLKHPARDKYWQDMGPHGQDFAKIDIPVLSITGYYDDSQISALQYVKDHFKYHRNPDHTLLIGPYDHSTTQGRPGPMLRGYALDPVARIDVPDITYQWFDHILRGGPRPALLKDKINYQVMGANVWRHAPSLDKMGSEVLKLYLTNVKSGEEKGRHSLSGVKPVKPGHLSQSVDFADRKISQNDYYPFPIVGRKPDLTTGFTFISEPFAEPLSIDGALEGELKVTINKRDMDVGVNLYEVMPNGELFQITYFIGRASYARDMSARKLLTPGKLESIPFDRVRLASRQMSKGSRLLVTVDVNKNDGAQVNHGTGKDVSDESIADAKVPLQVKWHNDSYVRIPIRR